MFRGGQPNMQQMMKQVQKMQEAMAKVQADLDQKSVTGDAGGGMVKATVSGKKKLLKIEIAQEVVVPAEKDMLEDLVLIAVNQALENAEMLEQQEMKKVTGGGMPGMPGF